MRTLIYVPIIHTGADLGSMAKDVTERGIARLGEEIWAKHRRTVVGFWDVVSDYFDSIDAKGMKIYQDGMIADGEVGLKIIEETAKAGSKNYQLLLRLLKGGASLVKTEDFRLVKEEYDRLLAITQAHSKIRKIVALVKYRLAKGSLLNKRDSFIAKRIDQTLEPGEKGVIFIGAYHRVKNRLPKNVHITEVKDSQKVRRYQSLLPYQNRYREQFDELGAYLVSEIDYDDERRF